MLDENDIRNIVYFLNKTALTGQESITHATLLVKMQNILAQIQAQAQAKAKEAAEVAPPIDQFNL